MADGIDADQTREERVASPTDPDGGEAGGAPGTLTQDPTGDLAVGADDDPGVQCRRGGAGCGAAPRRRGIRRRRETRPALPAGAVEGVHDGVRRFSAGPACGVELIDPDMLRREIGSDAFCGDPEERPGPTSVEDEQRLAFLRRYAAAPGGLFRRHVVADGDTLSRLAALRAEAPNAAKVVDVVERAATLSWRARSPLRLPPLLIVGGPGTGKSRVARRIAEALGVASTTIDGGSTTDRGPWVGHEVGYKGAGPGQVARALLDGPTTGPVVLVDEIDKVSAYAPGVRPLDALLPALEPGTASRFVDTYVALPMTAAGVSWVMTANSTAGLAAPLLDRVTVVAMPRLGRAEARCALQRLFAELLAEHGLPDAALGEAALDRLGAVGLRQARRTLQLALGPALAAGRPAPDGADVAGASALVTRSGPRVKRRSGPTPARPRRPGGVVHFPPRAAAYGTALQRCRAGPSGRPPAADGAAVSVAGSK